MHIKVLEQEWTRASKAESLANANCVIVTFNDPETVPKQAKEVKKDVKDLDSTLKILCETKSDISTMELDAGYELMKDIEFDEFFTVSAKFGTQVNELFNYIARECLERHLGVKEKQIKAKV